MKKIPTHLIFAAVLTLVSASTAQAFTFESAAPGDGGGAARNYVDPQDQISPKAGSPQRFNDEGQNGQRGGFGIQFGGQPQSFDQKYNSNDYFNPLKQR